MLHLHLIALERADKIGDSLFLVFDFFVLLIYLFFLLVVVALCDDNFLEEQRGIQLLLLEVLDINFAEIVAGHLQVIQAP